MRHHPVVFKLEAFVQRMERDILAGRTPSVADQRLLAQLEGIHEELTHEASVDAAREALIHQYGEPRTFSPILGRSLTGRELAEDLADRKKR